MLFLFPKKLVNHIEINIQFYKYANNIDRDEYTGRIMMKKKATNYKVEIILTIGSMDDH